MNENKINNFIIQLSNRSKTDDEWQHSSDEHDVIRFHDIDDPYKRIKWKFPPIKHCAVSRCIARFKTRSLAIEHYRKQHAHNYKFCRTCDRPVGIKEIVRHNRSLSHQNAQFNQNVNSNEICIILAKLFSKNINLIFSESKEQK